MERKIIGSVWSREQRNAINDNFKKLFDEYTKSGLDASEAKEKAIQAVADSVLAKDLAETTRQEMLEIIREQTRNGDLAPEIAQARGGKATIGERFNSIDSDLAQKATKEELNQTNLNLRQKDENVNERIDGLVINRGQDSSAEVADARQDFLGKSHSLVGERIDSDVNYLEGINNYTTVPIKKNGIVIRIDEMNGTEIVSSVLLHRNSKGEVVGTTKTVGGKSVISTFNKNSSGQLVSIGKEVI